MMQDLNCLGRHFWGLSSSPMQIHGLGFSSSTMQTHGLGFSSSSSSSLQMETPAHRRIMRPAAGALE